jgi:transcriptional regulator with XRE-family HTH domain
MFAMRVGGELRRLRRERGLRQREVGGPLTAAFVSAVEGGLIVPSLPSLALMLDALQVTFADFFAGVERANPGEHPAQPEHSSMTWYVESAL